MCVCVWGEGGIKKEEERWRGLKNSKNSCKQGGKWMLICRKVGEIYSKKMNARYGCIFFIKELQK